MRRQSAQRCQRQLLTSILRATLSLKRIRVRLLANSMALFKAVEADCFRVWMSAQKRSEAAMDLASRSIIW